MIPLHNVVALRNAGFTISAKRLQREARNTALLNDLAEYRSQCEAMTDDALITEIGAVTTRLGVVRADLAAEKAGDSDRGREWVKRAERAIASLRGRLKIAQEVAAARKTERRAAWAANVETPQQRLERLEQRRAV